MSSPRNTYQGGYDQALRDIRSGTIGPVYHSLRDCDTYPDYVRGYDQAWADHDEEGDNLPEESEF